MHRPGKEENYKLMENEMDRIVEKVWSCINKIIFNLKNTYYQILQYIKPIFKKIMK